eukprot:scaffold30738_cov105-Isochrysis_galbana.AAC.1
MGAEGCRRRVRRKGALRAVCALPRTCGMGRRFLRLRSLTRAFSNPDASPVCVNRLRCISGLPPSPPSHIKAEASVCMHARGWALTPPLLSPPSPLLCALP